jgi:hypothetical protein
MAFNKIWRYFVIGDKTFPMDEVLKCIPPCISFLEIPESFTVHHNSIYGDYPMPNSDWQISIFRADDPNFHITNAIGITEGKKCCVGWKPSDPVLVLGLRMWHEALHAMGADADGMVTASRDRFTAWLQLNAPAAFAYEFATNYALHEHDPAYQKYFYLMLMTELSPACDMPKLECVFDAEPESGIAPLSVDFFDMTVGYPTSWRWGTSNQPKIGGDVPHCTYTFASPGSYIVSLTVSNIYESSTATKTITVNAPAVSPLQRIIDFLRRLLGR